MFARGWGFIKNNLDVSSSPLYNTGKRMKENMQKGNQLSNDISLLKSDQRDDLIQKQLEAMDKSVIANPTNAKLAESVATRKKHLEDLRNIKGDVDIKKAISDREAELKGLDRDIWTDAKGAPGQAWDFMMAGDKVGDPSRFKTGAMRTGAVVGGYMGVNAGLRAMSGGGMTYNSQGQRDIAGIPFI